MLSSFFLLFSIAGIAPVFAESSFTGSPTTTSAAPAATWTVLVGADGFNFSPHELNASIGDTVVWQFYPQNHSVVRGGFGIQPCIPYQLTGPGLVGFWSGFVPVQLVLPNPPSYSIKINDTAPMSFYCSAPGACPQGMIGVVNPNATHNWASQFALTQNATEELSPGESFPAETGKPIRTTTATGATMTPTPVGQTSSSSTSSTTSAAATSVAPTASGSSSSSISTGAIVGIAIGGFAVIVLAAALLYMCGRQKTVNEILRQSQQTPLNAYQPSSPEFSEANYPNMHKPPLHEVPSPGLPYTDEHSYRSTSPALADERAHMMGMIPATTHHYNGHTTPNSNPASPGFSSTGFPSPTYTTEMDHGTVGGMRPYNPAEHIGVPPPPPQNHGPHELPVPSQNPSIANPPPPRSSNDNRPFSYTDSESGYHDTRAAGAFRGGGGEDEKNDSVLR